MIGKIVSVGLLGVLTVGLIGTGYWGYQEHQDKNSILIKAENNYQRAFHDLNNNITNLEDELGKSIAMNSRNLIAPCMTNIWRIAYVAQNNVGQLPLTMMAFGKTEEFLADIADFTYDIGMRDLEGNPLSDEEWNQLKTLHGQAKEIRSELTKVQSEVLNNNLRWMDVEVALASANQDMDRTIVDGFQGLDKQVEGYIETEMGATHSKKSEAYNEKNIIKGKEISEQQAQQKAQEFLKAKGYEEVHVSKNGEGKDFTSYSVTFQKEDNQAMYVEVARHGGDILWFLNNRDIDVTSLSLYEANNKALEFLSARGMDSMVNVESDQYDNVGVFDFVYEKEGVRIYPESVTVKVALDDGAVIGYQATDFVINHEENKEIPKASISLEQAKAKLNKNLKIQEDHLSMIETKMGEVKLCYELLGTIENETYRIFVNAKTGEEEKIEKMKQTQPL
ncbi:germination protein YpeB [Bacillus horti]|uniref:Spore germination protein n=1 Tax=Caldalkalibacillus horti TaxID=77523 RepID=A0ABT9W5L1_9BACI|nr:germination protein YpeB [Bacillus horti]MDQ0168521.1 spore germination protein [Bacillus horti]